MLDTIFGGSVSNFTKFLNSLSSKDFKDSDVTDILNTMMEHLDHDLIYILLKFISKRSKGENTLTHIIDTKNLELFTADLNTRNNLDLTVDEVFETLCWMISSCDFQLQDLFILILRSKNKGGNANEL